jgi:hypothetical protein
MVQGVVGQRDSGQDQSRCVWPRTSPIVFTQFRVRCQASAKLATESILNVLWVPMLDLGGILYRCVSF